MLVVGIEHSSGTYNGVGYDNYKLHCLCETSESDKVSGQLTEVVKVPKVLFEQLSVNVGDDIHPSYDKYGRLVKID